MRREVAGFTREVLARCQPHRHSAQLCTRPATGIFSQRSVRQPVLLLADAMAAGARHRCL